MTATRLLGLTAVLVSLSLVAAGCGQTSQTPRNAAADGNEAAGDPTTLAPLPGTTGTGQLLPIYKNSVVTPSNSTAVSTQPTLDSGETVSGQYTYFLAPLSSDPNVRWQQWQDGSAKSKVPAGAGLKDGLAYQWKVAKPGGEQVGPFTFTVDLSVSSKQDSESTGPISVALATGVPHLTWAGHAMQSASGSIKVGLDYSPVNDGWPGSPKTWRLVSPSAVNWDSIRVQDGGAISIHGKNNSTINYRSTGNGAYEAMFGAKGQAGPTGMFGALVKNQDESWTLTDPASATTVFSKVTDGVGWVTSVSAGGQSGIKQEYDGSSGRISRLTDSTSGRSVEVAYGGKECPTFAGFVKAPDGMICEIKFWDGSTSAFGYVDTPHGVQLGRLVDNPSAGSAGASVTDVAYDTQGRLSRVRTPDIAAAAASPAARVVTGDNPADSQLLYEIMYDESGRVSSIAAPAPNIGATRASTTYTYSRNTTTSTSSIGMPPATTTYDPNTLATVEKTMNGLTSKATFDQSGNPVRKVDQAGGVTTSKYDSLGMQTSMEGPGGSRSTYKYDLDLKPGGAASKPLQGLDVKYWANKDWLGAPSTSQLGPRPAPMDPLPGVLSLTWREAPVPDASQWSARMSGRITLPAAATYRFAVHGVNNPQFWINNNKCDGDICAKGIRLEAGDHAIRIDMWANSDDQNNFQLEYSKDSPSLQSVPMWMLSPAYNLQSIQTSKDQLSAGKDVTLERKTTYAAPEVGQVATVTNSGGLSTEFLYQQSPHGFGSQPVGDGTGSTTEGDLRTVGTRLPAGNEFGVQYWGVNEKANSGCSDQPNVTQGGAAKASVAPNPSDGRATGIATTTWFTASGAVAASQTGDAEKNCMYYDDAGRSTKTTSELGHQYVTSTFGYAVGGNPLVNSVTSAVLDGGATSEQVRTTTVTTDLLGRKVSSEDGWGTQIVNKYDNNGRIVSETTTTKGGSYTTAATVQYDNVGQVVRSEVSDSRSSGKPIVFAVPKYDKYGRLKAVSYSNGSTGETTYEEESQLPESVTWKAGDASTWGSSNSYSPAGRILATAITHGTDKSEFSYVYDTSTRLESAKLATSVPVSAKSWEFGYDSNSNRTSQKVDGKSISYAYDKSDRLTDINGDSKLSGKPTYDNRGNITQLGSLTMTYGLGNQVLSVADSSTKATVTYERDSSADVIAKTTSRDGKSTTIRYTLSGLILSDQNQPLVQSVSLPGGVVVQRNIDLSVTTAPAAPAPAAPAEPAPTTASTPSPSRSAPDSSAGSAAAVASPAAFRLAAARDRSGVPTKDRRTRVAGTPDGQNWLYPDINTNVMIATNGSGSALAQSPSLYDAFGQALTVPPIPKNPSVPQLGWQGAANTETDSLGIDVMLKGDRLYVPAIGRFTQVDPTVGGSANNYDYANQDPINGSDPTGNAPWWRFLIAVLAVVVISAVTDGLAAFATPFLLATLSPGWSMVVGATITVAEGAFEGAAEYYAMTEITGSEWSWTSFAISVGIGISAGAWFGAMAGSPEIISIARPAVADMSLGRAVRNSIPSLTAVKEAQVIVRDTVKTTTGLAKSVGCRWAVEGALGGLTRGSASTLQKNVDPDAGLRSAGYMSGAWVVRKGIFAWMLGGGKSLCG